MKILQIFLLRGRFLLPICFIIFPFAGVIYSQEPRLTIPYETQNIQNMDDDEFLDTLKRVGNETRKFWIQNDQLRFAAIRKFDRIFDKRHILYEASGNLKIFLESDDGKNFLSANKLSVSNQNKKNGYKKNVDTIRAILLFENWSFVFDLLNLNKQWASDNCIEANLSWIKNRSTISFLGQAYQNFLNEPYDSSSKIILNSVSPSVERRNITYINKRIAQVEEVEFIHYKSNSAKARVLKSIDLYHDNDFFIPPSWNQDRDLTGGGDITFSTDLFKARWLNWGWMMKAHRNKLSEEILSYQSFSFGAKAYTPYIRYRDRYALADTLYAKDRPFGSVTYIARKKYRLWPRGLTRSEGTIMLGKIGSSFGRNFQAALHRDATIASQFVYGWDKQIAEGGRWFTQINHKIEWMLFSATNKYVSILTWNKTQEFPKRGLKSYIGLNVIGTTEINIGGYQSSFDIGVKLASLDFTNHSGQKFIKAIRHNSKAKAHKNRIYEFGIYGEFGYRLRHVIHNSMLEGFGYFRTFRDDRYDNESETIYTLNNDWYKQEEIRLITENSDQTSYKRPPKDNDQVKRILHFLDFRLNVRWRKMTVYVHSTLHSKEFVFEKLTQTDYENLITPELLKAPENSIPIGVSEEEDMLNYYNFFFDVARKELEAYKDRKLYGYGAIGITWLID